MRTNFFGGSYPPIKRRGSQQKKDQFAGGKKEGGIKKKNGGLQHRLTITQEQERDKIEPSLVPTSKQKGPKEKEEGCNVKEGKSGGIRDRKSMRSNFSRKI